jgi:hypothetical protein
MLPRVEKTPWQDEHGNWHDMHPLSRRTREIQRVLKKKHGKLRPFWWRWHCNAVVWLWSRIGDEDTKKSILMFTCYGASNQTVLKQLRQRGKLGIL